MPPDPLVLDTQPLSIDDVRDVARSGRPVALGDRSREAIAAARRVIEDRTGGSAAVYGVNTGFGSLSQHRIEPSEVRAVQRNLVRSHAAGVGDALPDEVVRGMLVILAASLARGHSGVRPIVVERLLDLLAHDITPVIPSRGSVGASGDLAPLAHLALVLIGEGEARVGNVRKPGGEALAAAGLAPVELESKEGLALINGTHLITSIGALALADVQRLVAAAIGAAAMAIDACRASDTPLDARLHAVRGQDGQQTVARRLRALVAGSQILAAHREDDPRVQDPYCLRAAPQVIGATLDAIGYVETIIGRELGAVSDNPLVFPDGNDVISGANFHGMPLAIAMDLLTVALAPLAGIAERRVYWLLKASDSENPVNVYLSPQPGLHSGLMITQYTAAACCNELQTLAVPACVANIPTSAGIEDYNSMGATSAHQARAAVALARNVVAIELLVMAEALEYQRPLRSGAAVEAVHDLVRGRVRRLTEDRPPAPDIAAIADLIAGGAFVPITPDE
ncbi:MAG: histidine ammonia-lyase [Planctomycetes bacterium]|nr:histidine ammonia-lyase [Planctomycetota bacterium]